MDQKDFLRIENGVVIGYEDIPENAGTLIIPDGVTGIGKEAFSHCNYSQIIIPDSVESIEAGAFYNCQYLESVSLSKGLKAIPENCFAYCDTLFSVKLPETLEEIGDDAFCECFSLLFHELPETLEKIGNKAFFHCGIEMKRLPANLKHIGAYAFAQETTYFPDQGIEELSFSEDLQEIQDGAFQYCSFKSLRLPSSLKRIGKNAFKGCCKLTTIVLPDTLEEIDDYAFYESSLKVVQMPVALRRIGKYAFAESRGLEWIKFNSCLEEIDDGAFKNCKFQKVSIHSCVRRIGAWAFDGCSQLNYILFPLSLQEIGKDAFRGCHLSHSILPQEMKQFAQKANINDYSENIIEDIIEYLSDWNIPGIFMDLLTGNGSGCEGNYRIRIKNGYIIISIDFHEPDYDPDDMYYTYHFSPEEFLQIMNELRNIHVRKYKEKNTIIDSVNRLYDKLADYLNNLPKQDPQDTSSQ